MTVMMVASTMLALVEVVEMPAEPVLVMAVLLLPAEVVMVVEVPAELSMMLPTKTSSPDRETTRCRH